MLKNINKALNIKNINVNKKSLTYSYDVAMMYRNYIKNDIEKYKFRKKKMKSYRLNKNFERFSS